MIINFTKIKYLITHYIIIRSEKQNSVRIYLNCEQDISDFALRMKLPAAAKDQQDKCHQGKIDVDQEVTQRIAKTKHVEETSATNHQTNQLYESNASYVIEITRAKYK